MTKIYRPLVTPEYSTLMVNELRKFTDESCYLTIGQRQPWSSDENIPEFQPPLPINDNNYKFQFIDNVIGYVRIAKENTRLVIDRLDWVYGQSYQEGDIVVVYDYATSQSSLDQWDENPELIPIITASLVMYRCTGTPNNIGEGTCAFPDEYNGDINVDKSVCEANDGIWTPNPVLTPPNTYSANEATGDGYTWEYLYTIPPIEVSDFCTKEYVVVPSEEELIGNLEYWSRDMISTTIFDHGRMCYSIGANKLMVKTILADDYFRDMLNEESSYRQIGIVYKPYAYELAAPCGESSPWFGVNGHCSLFGWKIIALPATQATYSSLEILPNTGELLYMENRAPIIRAFNEINDIRIIFGF